MNVFRDSTATLFDRIHRLERENARLRRREQLHFRDRIFSLVRTLAQLIAVFAALALALFVAMVVTGLMVGTAMSIAHA
jgi:hypothetical protein